MYRVYGILMPESALTISELHRRISTRLPQYAVLLAEDQQITIESADWEFELRLVEGEDVQAEHAAIAEGIGGEDASYLGTSTRRVEGWSETPDPTMDHFDDFQAVVEVLKSFDGVVVVDPKEPAIL